MADKDAFAERLARIEQKHANGGLEPDLMAGVTADAPGAAPAPRKSRGLGLAVSLCVGLGLIGGAFYTMLLHMEQDAPGLRAAIATEGSAFNPLAFLTQSNAGEESWNAAQNAELEDRYLNEDGSSKLSDTGRFILNN